MDKKTPVLNLSSAAAALLLVLGACVALGCTQYAAPTERLPIGDGAIGNYYGPPHDPAMGPPQPPQLGPRADD